MKERQLTSFQENIALKVESILQNNKISFQKELAGKNELFIYYHTQKNDLKIWIYEDEAELRIRDVEHLYESQSFVTHDELEREFLRTLEKVAI